MGRRKRNFSERAGFAGLMMVNLSGESILLDAENNRGGRR